MENQSTAEGDFVILDRDEYEKALWEKRIVSTAGSPHPLLLPERKPVTAAST